MDNLKCISPIDGRYRQKTSELNKYFSEFAYQYHRIFVEIEYLIFYTKKKIFNVLESDFENLRNIYRNFDVYESNKIKEIEKTTNHDIKAIEYYIREKCLENKITFNYEYIHFGLTSQDINSVSNSLRLKNSVSGTIVYNLSILLSKIKELGSTYINIPMLSRTHGQTASPTLLGKEIYVFYERLYNQFESLNNLKHYTKFGGAVGNFNAHYFVDDKIDWISIADEFINSLELKRNKYTTQIDHYDNYSIVFDNLNRICIILVDFCRDIWQYISYGYFIQKVVKTETGSSTMPHKVNPIDFENAEGNYLLASNLLQFFSRKLPISRLQRDLTDSTITRNIGTAIAHMLIGIKSTQKGLEKLSININKIDKDLEDNNVVIAEGIQTLLRYLGVENSYEKVKELTRNNTNYISSTTLKEFIKKLDLEDCYVKKIENMTAKNYTGKVSLI